MSYFLAYPLRFGVKYGRPDRWRITYPVPVILIGLAQEIRRQGSR
jgi:hypothetical protein